MSLSLACTTLWHQTITIVNKAQGLLRSALLVAAHRRVKHLSLNLSPLELRCCGFVAASIWSLPVSYHGTHLRYVGPFFFIALPISMDFSDEIIQLIIYELNDPTALILTSRRFLWVSQDPYVRAHYFLTRYGHMDAMFWALGRGKLLNEKVIDVSVLRD